MNVTPDPPDVLSKSDIYSLPISGKHLVYSPLKKLAALVNEKAVEELRQWLDRGMRQTGPVAGLEPLCVGLRGSDKYVPEKRTGPVAPAFLGIIPSRGCNLACVYCSFGATQANREQMSPGVAASAVEWMAGNCERRGARKLEIHFFGGEPLIAPEVVEVVIHKARAMAGSLGLTPYFELSTNGIFDQDWVRFVGDYVDTVVLSLDGPPEIHDLHRPRHGGQGSMETVVNTARHLASSAAELCLRACVSSSSVGRMDEITRWFCDSFNPAVINFETLQPTPGSESAGLRPPDPYDFARHFIRAANVAESLGVGIVHASAEIAKPRFSFCPVGSDTLIVSPDGRISGCYLPGPDWEARGLDLGLGRINEQGAVEIDFSNVEALRRMTETQPERCVHCFCRWTCSGGCRVNHSYPGCSRLYDDFCIQTRIITACRLLKSLDLSDMVDSLIQSPSAMESLALRTSDRLEDWEKQDGHALP